MNLPMEELARRLNHECLDFISSSMDDDGSYNVVLLIAMTYLITVICVLTQAKMYSYFKLVDLSI